MYKIGLKIKKYRLQRGISQMDLEVNSNIPIGSVSRIENSKINPTKETLYKISKCLNLSPAEFIDLLCYTEYMRIDSLLGN